MLRSVWHRAFMAALATFVTGLALFSLPQQSQPLVKAARDQDLGVQSLRFGGGSEYQQVAREKPKVYLADCTRPLDRDQADLCEQRRMAKAAEQTVALADAQYWWNIAQAFATVCAALATAWAAWAASQAARASNETIQVFIAADLPRLRLSRLVFGRAADAPPRDNSKYATVTIGFANYGGKAARVAQYCFEMKCAARLPAEPAYETIRNVFANDIIVAADGEYTFPPLPYMDTGNLQLAEVLAHKTRFWVYGYVKYLDHLDREHSTGFVAWWNHYGTGHDSFPDEVTQRGETFNLVRMDRYTYST